MQQLLFKTMNIKLDNTSYSFVYLFMFEAWQKYKY